MPAESAGSAAAAVAAQPASLSLNDGSERAAPPEAADGAGGDDHGTAPPAVAAGPGPCNRYEIRILPDGRVVFVDLPEGLAEVAQVVAGSAAGWQRSDDEPTGDEA